MSGPCGSAEGPEGCEPGAGGSARAGLGWAGSASRCCGSALPGQGTRAAAPGEERGAGRPRCACPGRGAGLEGGGQGEGGAVSAAGPARRGGRKGRGAGCAVALLSEGAGAGGRYKGSSAVPRRLGLPRPRHLPPRRRGRGQGRAG